MYNEANDSYSSELKRSVASLNQTSYYFQEGLFRPDDVFLASYPRSGNHFVRFIILSARYFQNYGVFPCDFSTMSSIPDVHNQDVHLALEIPRIIKTHFPYDPRYRNVIHLVRDPRDVAVSYYHYACKSPRLFFEAVDDQLKIHKFVDLFVRGKTWPCDYGFHTQSFISASDKINYIRIDYERLLLEPVIETKKLLAFLKISLNDEAVEALVKHTKFDNMCDIHDPESARSGHVFPDRRFMLRKGRAGGFVNALNKPLLTRIEQIYGGFIQR